MWGLCTCGGEGSIMRPMWKALLIAVGIAGVFASSAQAQILLGVTREDNSGAALNANGAFTYVDWFFVTPTSATYNTSISLNGATTWTNAGSATSEGHLTKSVDGRYLTLGGYNAPPGTSGVAGTAGTAVQRKVALID